MGTWAGKVGLAAAIAGVAVLVAPSAHADNASYLAALEGKLHSADGGDGLLRAGKGACGMLQPQIGLPFGINANEVAQIVWKQNPTLERGEAALLVNTAIDNLCPNPNIYGYAAG